MRSALVHATAAAFLLANAPFLAPASAQGGPPVGASAIIETQSPRFKRRGSARVPQVDCTCRYRDRDIFVGDAVCMNGKLARCEMVLNNTSWSVTKDACPIASRSGDADQSRVSARN